MDLSQLAFNLNGRFHGGHQQGAVVTQGPLGPGLTYGGETIHDPANPVDEALGWIKNAKRAGSATPGLALVFGLGLGWHLKLLRKQYPGIKLVVFEPVPALKEAYERDTVMTAADGPAPIIITDWPEYEKTASREIVYGEQAGLLVLTPDGYRALKPEAHGAFERYALYELTRRRVVDRTRESTGWDFLRNLAKNVAHIADCPDLMLLKGRLPARAAVAVGSGPSLDDNIGDLRLMAGKGLVFAAASALKPLLDHGLSPDVTVVVESSDTSDYLRLDEAQRAVLAPGAVLALASGCHPNHFLAEGFHRALFHLTAGEAQTFSRGVFLPQGGNAGSAAFSLAYALGLNPLILVGQDQAFSGGRLHAASTPGDERLEGLQRVTVAGVHGTEVETDSGLLASINWYAEAARTIGEISPQVSLYNASAAGAHLEGFAEVPLADLAASLAPLESPIDLAAALPRLPRPAKKEVRQDVAQMAAIVGSLRRMAQTTPKRAYDEINNVRQISRFLGQVLAEASVSGNKADLVASLDKADQFMAVMLGSLGR